jgi:hypothetical protein
MKKKLKKLIFIAIIAILSLGISCDKFKADTQYNGVSLYKTKGDYFDKVTVGIKKDENRIFRTSDAYEKVIITETDTIPKFRAKLVNNYVLDGEGDHLYDAFLSLTFKKLIVWEDQYGRTSFIADTAWKYVIDKDPYLEFYRAKDNKMFQIDGLLDTAGLNQIIMEDGIDEFFTKLK